MIITHCRGRDLQRCVIIQTFARLVERGVDGASRNVAISGVSKARRGADDRQNALTIRDHHARANTASNRRRLPA